MAALGNWQGEYHSMKLSIQENRLPGKNTKERFDKAKEHGFKAIEIWGTDLANRFREIKEISQKNGIDISTVCSGYRGCLLSSEREERARALKDIKEMLSMCAELGAIGLIVVPIFGPPQLLDSSPGKSAEELEKELLTELLFEIGQKAEQVSSLCLLEPLNRYETHLINKLSDAVQICKEVNNPGVKVMADFFHMNIEEKSIDEAIVENGEFIYHLHLADSNRLLPGYGHTDFKKGLRALKQIGFDKYMAFECRIPGNFDEEIAKSINYLCQCMK